MSGIVNPELDQDRINDLFTTFEKYHYAMFPQQEAIYYNIRRFIDTRSVIEAGCGIGTGAEIMSHWTEELIATDKLQRNIDFARCLYPNVEFDVWDIQKPDKRRADIIVCVETIEHIADPLLGLRNLFDVAEDELFISTPNGNVSERPPSNLFHVCEYTPTEMIEMIRSISKDCKIEILSWKNFQLQSVSTEVSPLVYRILK